jgi:L-aminopeptidase/D-esterase-like protein
MQWLRVGHYTNAEQGTGISVFLFEKPAIGSYCLCGSSPATYELATLDLDAHVSHINGLVFTGGSAFGLPAVGGVVQWMQESQKGWQTAHALVPIIPAAAIYDLGYQFPYVLSAEHAYQACLAAVTDNFEQGNIGAGTGATVGKIIPGAYAMRGGLGFAEITLASGVCVRAYAVVNSVGDVLNLTGDIIAGAINADGSFVNCSKVILNGGNAAKLSAPNTTLVALFTNAHFSKIELKRIAKMAVAGMARAISPIFTCYDGDIIFCFSAGDKIASELSIGSIAAEATQLAIINAVKDSTVVGR